ncbi:MAG: hypothetical protein M3Z37_11340, partial [Candidatus Eremiobacteraeota bacterium]|nr:hypothetical protein [Candidatus Eremiobacteraeota bacterium]
SAVQRIERQLGARVLAFGMLDRECRRRRLAIVALMARSRHAVFARPQLSALDCFALSAFTGYCAERAGMWQQRQDDAAKSIASLAQQRAQWARLRKGLERRTPAATRPSTIDSV